MIDVLDFLVLWSNMLVKCAKNELMTLNQYPQQTFQLMLDLIDMLHEAGYTAKALGDISAGTHARIRYEQASSLMFQALNLLSTRSMGHHAMLNWGWLGIRKTNVLL